MSAVNFSFRSLAKRSLFHLLTALFATLMASSLPAQIVETGTITGVVKDNSGAVIPKERLERVPEAARTLEEEHEKEAAAISGLSSRGLK